MSWGINLRRSSYVIALIALSVVVHQGARALPLSNSSDDAVRVYRQRQEDATPKGVLDWLQQGNHRFAAGQSLHGGFPIDTRERLRVSAQGQRPLAVVLSCIDSRTSPELVFDTSVGDIFTARVGANVVNDDILGSLEIAVESGARAVVVLGHTDCGGIKAACSGLELGHMTQLLERVKPSIRATDAKLDHDPELSRQVGERTVGNRRYIAEISRENARASARQLLERSEVLREKVRKGEIILLSAVFDVDTGLVSFESAIEAGK